MNKFKRLHIISIISEFFKGIQRIILPAIFAYYLGESSKETLIFFGIELNNFIKFTSLLIAIIYGLYRWITFKYKVDNEGIRIKKGIFMKTDTYITKNKIKSMDITKGVIPRLFGLVQLKMTIEGTENNKPIIKLIAITKNEALYIQNNLFSKSIKSNFKDNNTFSTITLSNKDLLLTALTSNSIIPAFITILMGCYQFNDQLYKKIGMPYIESIKNYNIMIVIYWFGIILILAWTLSLIRTILRFGSFQLHGNKQKLFIQKGILEKKETIISINDIKAIRIEESIFKQPFGYASIYVESNNSENENKRITMVLHPFIKIKKVESFLNTFSLPYPSLIRINTLPNKSKIRYIFRKIILAISISIINFTNITNNLFLSIFIIIIFSIWGYLQFRDTSYGFSENNFLLTSRLINKNTVIFNRKHIETIRFSQTLLQRKKNLQSLKIIILSNISKKKFKLIDYTKTHEDQIHQWYIPNNNKELKQKI